MAQVLNPGRGNRQNPLEIIGAGLNIAKSIIGMKQDSADRDIAAKQRETEAAAKADQDAGIYTPGAAQELAIKQGWQPVEPTKDDKGGIVLPEDAVKVKIRTPKGVEEVAFRKPLEEEKPQLKEGTDGNMYAVTSKGATVVPGYKGKVAGGMTPEQVADRNRKITNEGYDSTDKLRKEWKDDPITKKTSEMVQSIRKIRSTSDTPQGDMSLIYAYMAMLDPGTAVKEGEYAQAEDTRNLPQEVVGLYNKAVKGVKLLPEQRAGFKQEAETLYGAQLEAQSQINEYYTGIASQRGFDPNNVINEKLYSLPKKEAVADQDSGGGEDLEFRKAVMEEIKRRARAKDTVETDKPRGSGIYVNPKKYPQG